MDQRIIYPRNGGVAIIVPESDKLAAWAAENGTTAEKVLAEQDSAFKAVIMDEIAALGTSKKLNSLEKPKEIFLAPEPFSVENDILTPTFKLKRNIGQKIYKAQIDAMYESLEARGL